jgi:hypothetical protein
MLKLPLRIPGSPNHCRILDLVNNSVLNPHFCPLKFEICAGGLSFVRQTQEAHSAGTQHVLVVSNDLLRFL